MELSTPLFEKEFGYSITLHDAIVESVEDWVDDGVRKAKWDLKLYLSPAGSETYGSYSYRLNFTGLSSSSMLAVGDDIFDFMVDILDKKLLIRYVVLPSGMPLWFECSSARELSLEPVSRGKQP